MKLTLNLAIAFVMVLGSVASPASELEIPRGNLTNFDAEFGGVYVFEKHLAGYGNVAVNADGTAAAWARFTSELKLQGTRKVAVTVKLWAGEAVVALFPFDANLADAIFHGGHVAENRRTDFSLTKEQWLGVTKISYEFQNQSSVDCAFWDQKWKEGILLVDPKILGCN